MENQVGDIWMPLKSDIFSCHSRPHLPRVRDSAASGDRPIYSLWVSIYHKIYDVLYATDYHSYRLCQSQKCHSFHTTTDMLANYCKPIKKATRLAQMESLRVGGSRKVAGRPVSRRHKIYKHKIERAINETMDRRPRRQNYLQ